MDSFGGVRLLWQDGNKFVQPDDCTRRLVPSWTAIAHVVGCFVRSAHGDVAAVRDHRRLGASQYARHVLVG